MTEAEWTQVRAFAERCGLTLDECLNALADEAGESGLRMLEDMADDGE